MRNEGVKLRATAPALRAALEGLPATVIYALNDTTDDSHVVIQQTFGQAVRIIQLPTAGKTRALRAADAAARQQWRVYLDADILVEPDTLPALLRPLMDGQADLTAARLVADLRQCKGLALRVARVWADQLARRQDAFMCCTAMNEAGLKQRGPWPDVLADDDWARNRIDPDRRLIVETAKAYMSPPRDLRNWVKVRARWIRGARELKRIEKNHTPADRVRPRGSLPDLALYFITRLGAEPVALVQQSARYCWGRDNSTRRRIMTDSHVDPLTSDQLANPLANQLLKEEYRALKSEMLLRIAIQNLTILGAVVLFIPAALLIVTQPQHAGALALAYALANLSLALQWCHQGVRQCALKQAVLARDRDAGRTNSWEVWLPTQRPANPLGSRWFVSTKLVFMGLCAATITLALKDFGFWLVCAAGALAITTVALLTNPKE